MKTIAIGSINLFIALFVVCTGIPIDCNGKKYSKVSSDVLRFECMHDDTTKVVTESKKVGLFTFDSVYILKAYDTLGILKYKMRAIYGYPDGQATYYYPNGKTYMEGDFIKGKMHGEWLTYFRNGNIKVKSIYIDNVIVESTRFYNNGLTQGIFSYKNGKIDGIVEAYSARHDLKVIGYWQNGQIDSSIHYELPKQKKFKKLIHINREIPDTLYYK